ncbi:hypothetical protein [Thaumasiovibrio subtropicus]|uniref:hypothetical protein n=1 Tax=Thaumasiovibrio subtropicus TaxID=1891207 RepID=UPI000B360070|nr:hypothetical protein [Thaumasiovibrio subtropicus]
MLIVKARVYIKPESEGGLSKPFVSGMQPSFAVASDLIACKVIGAAGLSVLASGREHDVTIELPYGEVFTALIIEGYIFHLNFGGQELANGIVKNVLQIY